MGGSQDPALGVTGHLAQHQFTVDGPEPLARQPLSVRLYAGDDDQVRAMPDRGQFIRDAVRAALQQQTV